MNDVRGTDLIEVSFTTPSPSLSAFLAAAHTQAYIDTNEEARRANDVTAKEFLGQQLREARERVERAQEALRRFAAEHPDIAVNEEEKTPVAAGAGRLESSHQGGGRPAPAGDPLQVPRRAEPRSAGVLPRQARRAEDSTSGSWTSRRSRRR